MTLALSGQIQQRQIGDMFSYLFTENNVWHFIQIV